MFSCYVSFREVIVLDDILHVTCSQVEGAADDVRYSVFHKNGGPVKFRGLTTQNGPSFTVPKFNKRNILGLDIFSKNMSMIFIYISKEPFTTLGMFTKMEPLE